MKKRKKTKHNDANYEKRMKGMFLAKVRKNKKKFLAGLLAVAIASSGPTITHAQTNSETTYEEEYEVKEVKPVVEKVQVFNDVSKSHWAYENIAKLQGAGVIEESLNGNFYPNKTATRQEFTVYLMKALGIKSDKIVGSYLEDKYDSLGNSYTKYHLNRFYDVWRYSDAHPYIAAAYYNNIINGVSDIYFDPEGLITREQAAVIMVNTLNRFYDGELYGSGVEFTDSNQISSWAKEAVDKAATMNIFNGLPDGSFNPKGQITNAEIMTLIKRVVEKTKGIKFGTPAADYNYKTTEELLKEAGAKFSDWYFGNSFSQNEKINNLDGVTLKEWGMGGALYGDLGTSATIAIPLTGDEEWSPWSTYKKESQAESPVHPYSNGELEELAEKGIIKLEFKEDSIFKGTEYETKTISYRIKENTIIVPMYKEFTYHQRDIINLDEVLKNNPELIHKISSIQPVKDLRSGEPKIPVKLPEPYKLKLTND